MEEAEAAAGALAEAAADSVLESAILDEPPLVRLRGLPWSYGTTEVSSSAALPALSPRLP
eukprot:scaffold8001_cov125-Isochrysis_galbana.AAC.3